MISRLGICHREEYGLLRHGLHHLGSYEVRLGNADECVSAPERVREAALDVALVGELRDLCMRRIRVVFIAVDDSAEVHHDEVAYAELQQELADGDSCGACAVDYDRDVGKLLAGKLDRVDHSGADNDRGSVLIIVEYWDIKLFLGAWLRSRSSAARRCPPG